MENVKHSKNTTKQKLIFDFEVIYCWVLRSPLGWDPPGIHISGGIAGDPTLLLVGIALGSYAAGIDRGVINKRTMKGMVRVGLP